MRSKSFPDEAFNELSLGVSVPVGAGIEVTLCRVLDMPSFSPNLLFIPHFSKDRPKGGRVRDFLVASRWELLSLTFDHHEQLVGTPIPAILFSVRNEIDLEHMLPGATVVLRARNISDVECRLEASLFGRYGER